MKIKKEHIQNICKLTPLQEGMLFHALLDPDSTAYIELTRYHLSGNLDLDAFRSSWEQLVARHEALRTVFLHKNTPEPVQVILKHRPIEFSYEDLSVLDPEIQDEALNSRMIQEGSHRFDLSQGPLMRLFVCGLSSESHEVFWTYHHIILDGWSLGVLQKEFWEIYHALANGGGAHLRKPAPFSNYVKWLRSQSVESAETYWKHRFAHPLPPPSFQRFVKRYPKKPFSRDSFEVFFSKEISEGVRSFARRNRISLNAALHAGWSITLNAVLGIEDVVFGETVSGRHPEIAGVNGMVGLLINAVPVRVTLRRQESLRDLALRVHGDAVEAEPYQFAALPLIQSTVGANGSLFDHILVFENYPEAEETEHADSRRRLVINRFEHVDHTNYGLTVQFMPAEQLGIRFIFDNNTYEPSLLHRVAETFQKAINGFCHHGDLTVEKWLLERGGASLVVENEFSVVLTATFTADFFTTGLAAFGRLFGLPIRVKIAPYHQVCQELLNPGSLTASNQGINILLVRWEDFLPETDAKEAVTSTLERAFEDVCHAVLARRGAGRYACVLLPVDPGSSECVQRIQRQWREFLIRETNLEVIDGTRLEQNYAIDGVFDSQSYRVGRIPFSDQWFAAASALLFRSLMASKKSEFKVIAVDCDYTLWDGVCGELGPTEVRIGPSHKALQNYLVEKAAEGFLIVLVSKNRESDVWGVFEKHPDMQLKLSDLVTTRINWNAKSDNLCSISKELNVGLDSFVFIDDSLVECLEVLNHVPEVLVVRAPDADIADPDLYFSHVWAFDRFRITEEDRQRGEMMRAEQARKQACSEMLVSTDDNRSGTQLDRFIRSLEVEADLRPIAEHQWARAAQLTLRTNQFNLTAHRMSEHELRAWAENEQSFAWIVRVRDRFGDYGVTGLICGRVEGSDLILDQFLLSCRILGRGVEEAILKGLSQHLDKRIIGALRVCFLRTERNQPALDFLERSAWSLVRDMGQTAEYRIELKSISQLKISSKIIVHQHPEPEQTVELDVPMKSPGMAVDEKPNTQRIQDWSNWINLPESKDPRNRAYSEMLRLTHASSLLALINQISNTDNPSVSVGGKLPRSGNRKSRPSFAPATTGTEKILLSVWEDLLGLNQIGIDEDFFDIGGHSLKATRMVSRIHKVFQKEISLSSVFEERTIRQLARKIDGGRNDWEKIPKLASGVEFVLSHSQHRMWALHQLEQNSIAYNSTGFYWIKGDVDVERLRNALVSVIQEHCVLRAVFQDTEQGLRMIVRDYDDSQVVIITESERGRPLSTQDLELYANDITRKSFRLDCGPLFLVRVLVMDSGRILLALHMHHIVSDGGSLDLFQREVMTRYSTSLTTDESSGFERTKKGISYPDYAVWHNQWVVSESGLRSRDYWIRQLTKLPPPLPLPTDRTRPPVQSFRGAAVKIRLAAPEWERLVELSLNEGGTRFSAFVAIVKILLHLHSRQEDILIGTVVSGRDHPDLESVVGLIANTIALRDMLDEASTVNDVFSQVAKTCREAFSHQGYPFDLVLESLNLERDLSRSALFDVMVNYHGDVPNSEENPIVFEEWEIDSPLSRFDLTFNALESESGLIVKLIYNVDIFDRERMDRIGQRLCALASNASQDPSVKLMELNMLPKQEIAWLHSRFYPERVDYPTHLNLTEILDEVATAHGSTLALASNALRLTYSELVTATVHIADALGETLGDCRRQIVAVSMTSRPLSVVAMLSVMRAGGCYLPVDPSYPKERIDYLLNDSGACVLITDTERHEIGDLAGELKVMTVDLSFLAEITAGGASTPLSRRSYAEGSDPAYVIYTSGSTGRPKGVSVTHQAFVNMITQQIKTFDVRPNDRVVMFASLSFDASLSEIFMALLSGATLYCPSRECILDGRRLVEYIQDEQITIATLPPLYLRALGQPDLGTLKTLITAGESAVPKDAAHYSKDGRLQYINAYGPTECSVCTSMFLVPRGWRGEKVPIGKPLDNLGVCIVDQQGRLVPVGHPGEILIRGDGLAEGYLGQPELTVQRFETRPQIPWIHGRLYSTGDLGQWTEEGDLLYLGRIDDQLKIRGHRVEPGEIEQILSSHESVTEGCVIGHQMGTGSQGLVAFYAGTTTQADLRAYLRERLPGHMVPTQIVRVDKLPVTPNGKIDKSALSIPEAEFAEAPRTPTQKELLWIRIWKNVLGVAEVRLDDSFFELGGDSIKAILAVNQMLRQGYQVEVRDLVLHPTIHELAPMLRTNVKRDHAANHARSVSSEVVPLTPIQHWFFRAFGDERDHFNHSEMLHSVEPFDKILLEQAIQSLWKEHDQLRARFRMKAETNKDRTVWEQYIPEAREENILREFDLTKEDQPDSRLLQFANQLQSSFRLSEGPLMAVGLFRCKDGDRLLFVIHHLVVDGVSWRLLLEDFQEAYQSLKAGFGWEPKARSASYSEWAHALVKLSSRENLARQRSYWKKVLSFRGPDLPLRGVSLGRLRSEQTFRSIELSAEETKHLLNHADSGSQVVDFILVGLGLALHSWSGMKQCLIAYETHGRHWIEGMPRIDVSRTVGWFTNVFPMILDIRPEQSLQSNVRRIAEARESVPGHGMGFGILAYLAGDANTADAGQQPRISFNYLGQYEKPAEATFEVGLDADGESVSSKARLNYDLEWNAILLDGRLKIVVAYAEGALSEPDVELLLRCLWESMVSGAEVDEIEGSSSALEHIGSNYEENTTTRR
ncbi:MAG: amino acid adenylation domain-containing protein [Verrucomicrobiota bacterium]